MRRVAQYSDEMTAPSRTLHTTASLALELGTSERTIRRAIEMGELRATRRAGRWVMTVADVVEWAENGRPAVGRRSPRRDLPRRRPRSGESLAAVFAEQDADAA